MQERSRGKDRNDRKAKGREEAYTRDGCKIRAAESTEKQKDGRSTVVYVRFVWVMAMDGLQKMLQIPLDFPPLVMTEAERSAVSNKTCVGYLQAVENDIVLRVFAFRRKKGKAMEITEIMRRITRDKRFIHKNLYGGGMQGYQPVYEKKDKVICSHGYPITVFSAKYFDEWDVVEDGAFGIYYKVINADMLKDTQFKYCAYTQLASDDVIGYLNEYIEHPCVEYFGKLGIKPSPVLVKKAEKDHSFRTWLYRNHSDLWKYGPKVIVYAYEHNMSLDEAREECHKIDDLNRRAVRAVPEISGTKLDRQRVLDYIKSKGIDGRSYSDYLKALKKCKYDLTDTKNIYPYDFYRMHDLRIAEYESVVAKEDAEKEKMLADNFEKRAQKAKQFEWEDGTYVAIIPSQIQELVAEGKALGHCVGRMGYDKKMADGKIVIVFIRTLLDRAKPLVTIEYEYKTKKVLQAYGDNHRKPTDEEQAFIDEWKNRTTEILKAKKGA